MDFIFDPSLVLYLPLGELDGGSFRSRDTYGHLGTVTGALWTPHGRNFDGSDDIVRVTDSDPLDITGEITILCWIRMDAVTSISVPMAKGCYWHAASSWGINFNPSGASVDFSISNLELISSNYNLVNWTCYGFVYKPGVTQKIYKNGEQAATRVPGNTAIPVNAYPVTIGSCDTTIRTDRWFAGEVGLVLIYNRLLTPLEIQHNYLATKRRY